MKKTFQNFIYRFCGAFIVMLALVIARDALALPASHYAESSVLSAGNWVKVRVSKPGIQFISNTQLTAMGFQDPSKVNVYGFGGRMISEILDDSHPDDLPLLPAVRTASGILFFGYDHFKWDPVSAFSYSHTMQPYAEDSYYFLSDRETDAFSLQEVDLRDVEGLTPTDSFVERLVHEQDLQAPGNSGRTLLGEDLRGTLQLNFNLPGNVGGDASLKVAVGSNISNSPGTLRFSSNNARLSQNTANIEVVKSSEQFMRLNTVNLDALGVGESLNLGLSFSTSGVINLVRLDYVEVFYERALDLGGGSLYFYFNESEDLAAVIKGATAETEIWDVTVGHAPRKVRFNLSGSEARFRIPNGYREYVAFNPSKGGNAVENKGAVANQNIHSMESPEMLIITPAEYLSAAERVAEMHRKQDGMDVYVMTPETIYNEFSSGTADVSAFRKLLKMWYDRDLEQNGTQKIKYCLLFSRATYDNKMASPAVKQSGYPRVPIWQSATGYTQNSSYGTDDYIGMLDDNNATLSMGSARIQIAVGRFPVRNLEEANTAVDKLISYTTSTDRGSWRNNVMLIADDQDRGQHLSQSQTLYNNMMATEKGSDYLVERLYLDNFELRLTSVGPEYPEAKKRLMSKLEEGQALVSYIGHANTVSWTHEHLLNWYDINSFSNTRLPILYAATCEFARIDDDEYSGGEVMWALPKTGVISMICPSRSVYINMNGPLSAQFGKFALTRNDDGSPVRLGDTYIRTKNGINSNDDNKLRYHLLGDPAMKMPVYSFDVETTSICDIDVTEEVADMPVIEARSKPVIKGVVKNADGSVASDFNGYLYLKLHDAEQVVETLGNGEDGEVMVYNDRKIKLYDGVTKVENGEWETVVFMPTEISNNFTQGRITYYALADDGREANGATDRFYVFGYDENAEEDTEGPIIHKFFLNNESFRDGDLSYKTPVVQAVFSDESGINLSEAGIGHTLTLTLDDKTVYSDVINFYTPDILDSSIGSFVYQMPELEAGRHTLRLTVWDCANNSSNATLSFNVAAVKDPDIFGISTSFNANSGVDFIISTDRPMASLRCDMEVYDTNGIRVWHNGADGRTDNSSTLKMNWDFTSTAGNRVSPGIYLCRVSVVSPEGRQAVKTKKIVVGR